MGTMLSTKLIRLSSKNTFDVKVRMLINSFIFNCDTLDQFKLAFRKQMDLVNGYGDDFRELFFITSTTDVVKVWRRYKDGQPNRLLMEVSVIKY
jgi:hypothetical protein